jgi:AsmA protein
MTILRTRDVDQWRIQALTLNDVNMLDDSGELDMAVLTVRNFAFGTPAPISTTLTYTPTDAEPIPVELSGTVTYSPDPERITIGSMNFSTDIAAGVCNIDAAPAGGAAPAATGTDDELIPLEIWRSYDWEGQCDLEHVSVEDQRFEGVTAALANNGGAGDNVLRIPEFFGGSATLNLSLDASNEPVRWTLTPDLKNVDSQQLMAWLDQRLQWIAPLAYGGTLTFEGNTPDELIASLSGETSFDGGQGAISVTKIKQPLLALATLLRKPEQISAWPDVWDYERFVGNWRIDKQHHNLDFALDNLTVTADGDYDAIADRMDMLAELTFATLPEGRMFEVNPLMMDLPIPVRCRGALENPKCRVDDKAAQRLVATVLTSEEGSAMRDKLDQKIDEEVPEEYRETARGLLDMLGGALQRNAQKEQKD